MHARCAHLDLEDWSWCYIDELAMEFE